MPSKLGKKNAQKSCAKKLSKLDFGQKYKKKIFWRPGNANSKAIEYYDTFASRLTKLKNVQYQEDDDQANEIEDVLVAYMESRESTKH